MNVSKLAVEGELFLVDGGGAVEALLKCGNKMGGIVKTA